MELNQRMPSLDGLRALSIAVVLIAHFTGTSKWWIGDFAYYGVRIFLVISGFLITSLLRSEKGTNRSHRSKEILYTKSVPYSSRGVRLPDRSNHLLPPIDSVDPPADGIYLPHMLRRALPWVLIQLWSLSVEEQFYLIWPALMALAILSGKRYALAAIAAAPIARFILTSTLVMEHWKGFYNLSLWSFPAVFDSIAAGCLLALYQQELARFGKFFRSKYFPLIWAATLMIPVGRHYLYQAHVWHGTGLAQTLRDSSVQPWHGVVYSKRTALASADTQFPACDVGGKTELQPLSVEHGLHPPRRPFMDRRISAEFSPDVSCRHGFLLLG